MTKLDFTPTNEMQVREWFAFHLAEFEYDIVRSVGAFPDYHLRDASGKVWRVEVEAESVNFIQHGHNQTGCDWVLCWVHNAVSFPLPVFELSTRTRYEPGEYNRDVVNDEDAQLRANALAETDATLRNAITMSGLYPDFLKAVALDLKAQSEASRMIAGPREELLKVTERLCADIGIDRVHPYDLFKLVRD